MCRKTVSLIFFAFCLLQGPTGPAGPPGFPGGPGAKVAKASPSTIQYQPSPLLLFIQPSLKNILSCLIISSLSNKCGIILSSTECNAIRLISFPLPIESYIGPNELAEAMVITGVIKFAFLNQVTPQKTLHQCEKLNFPNSLILVFTFGMYFPCFNTLI